MLIYLWVHNSSRFKTNECWLVPFYLGNKKGIIGAVAEDGDVRDIDLIKDLVKRKIKGNSLILLCISMRGQSQLEHIFPRLLELKKITFRRLWKSRRLITSKRSWSKRRKNNRSTNQTRRNTTRRRSFMDRNFS